MHHLFHLFFPLYSVNAFVLTICLISMTRLTEHSHVKTNMIHMLHRINSFGQLPLLDFKSLLTEDEYKRCENRKPPFSWHPLTKDVFITFLYTVHLPSVYFRACHSNSFFCAQQHVNAMDTNPFPTISMTAQQYCGLR